jgi:hypothetical protein
MLLSYPYRAAQEVPLPRRMLLLAALALAGCTSTPAPPAPVPSSPTASPAPVETPPLDSISLEPRETYRKCVGEKCMVRFDVVAHVEGPGGGSNPNLTWRVTYKVAGGIDGVQTGSFTMGKQRSEEMPSEVVTIEPSDAKIWIDVASIDLVPE